MSQMQHIERNIDSNNILSAYGVIISKGSLDTDDNLSSELRHIGLIGSLSWGDSRPVTQQGELGSKMLFALVNEGAKSLSFQRLLPFPDEKPTGALVWSKGSILSTLYMEELREELGEGVPLPVLALDIEEFDCFRRPIQLVITFNNEINEEIAKIWLKNASVSGASMNFAAGSQYSGEPTQISWEETIEMKL